MNSSLELFRTTFFACLIASLAVACAKPDQQPRTPTPLHEAYELMDRGQNAKAILLLENISRKAPDSDEARVLLASACLGEAGVDVYAIYDSFKEIIFAKSLEDSFWQPKADVPAPEHPKEKPVVHGKQAQEPAPLELLIDRLDLNLARVQNVTNLLSRFPDVAKEKWSLLDKALENLDSVTQSRDVHLYKVFIRVVYLKAFLGQEVVSDSDFGRKRWACKLDLEKLRENFVWITQNLVAASEDFRSVFPSKATSLDGMHGQLAGVLTILEEMKSSGPVGSNTGLLSAQLKLQSTFRCDTSSSAF